MTSQGLTIFETLTHCVDLGALPSPAFARMIIGKKDIDYKSEVAYPRRTVLDLALQHRRTLSLEDLLFQATPMKPRYYSIASSNIKHPNEIRLVYRRVQVSFTDISARCIASTSHPKHIVQLLVCYKARHA